MDDLSERRLRASIDEPKDGGLVRVSWTEGATGARLQFKVRQGAVELTVGGVYRAPDDQQIWLDHPGWKHGRRHLVRLCCTPKHGGHLHWHLYEGDPKLEQLRTYDGDQSLLDLSDRGTLLCTVFAADMKVVEFQYEGRLLP